MKMSKVSKSVATSKVALRAWREEGRAAATGEVYEATEALLQSVIFPNTYYDQWSAQCFSDSDREETSPCGQCEARASNPFL